MAEKKYRPNERLRHTRELRGWGQKELADRLGVPEERTIRRWEHGESLPTPYYRQRLCEVFGLNAEELGVLDPAAGDFPLPAVPREKTPPAGPRDKNRQRLLKKVQLFWIEGVLERSLYQTVLLRLGLEERPEALANPWQLALQQADLPARALPPETTIEAVYDQAEGEVLILGEPGAGKTTLLLEVARRLLERASLEETHPLPVVFHLSSWAIRRQPLADWLVEELHDKYQVPRALGQAWVEADQLLPLLDGLDEVDASSRTACIDALNAYIPEHSVPLVVCSRRAEYFAQAARLRLNTAVLVQPLTTQQIDGYLAKLGERLASLRSAIQQDPVLQDLVQTPLMLSILLLASEGHPLEELLTTASVEGQQRWLFTVYVERMLQRRSPTTRYTPEQTRHWLTWLAQRLQEHRQAVFYLEFMQPDWLPAGWPAQLYQSLVLRFWAGLVVGMIYGLSIGGINTGIKTYIFLGMLTWLWVVLSLTLIGVLVIGPLAFVVEWVLRNWLPSGVNRVLGGLLGSLLGGFIGGWSFVLFLLLVFPPFGIDPLGPNFTFSDGIVGVVAPYTIATSIIGLVGLFERHSTAPAPFWSWSNGWETLREALLIGVIGGLVSYAVLEGLYVLIEHRFAPLFYDNDTLLLDLAAHCLNMVTYALPSVLFTRSIAHAIQPVEVVNWSWRRARRGMGYGVILGILFVPLAWLFIWFSGHGLIYRVAFVVYFVLFGVFFGVLLGGLSGGVSKSILEERSRVRPNQLIWQSARNALRAGVFAGSICVGFLLLVNLVTIFLFGYYNELVGDVVFSLLVGALLGALIGGVWVGGLACLQHLLLRFLLWRTQRAPWHYPRFLDYAAERILLQKVGGGYLFTHRLLLDHFASLEISAPTTSDTPPPKR